MAPRIDPIRCLKYKTYQEYSFLKDAAGDDKDCIPPPNDSRCSMLVVRGPEKDGVLQIHCRMPRNEPITLLTENGDMYTGLSRDDVKKFYEGKLQLAPKKVDKDEVRSFFIKMFGGEEFTPKVRDEVCAKKDCTSPPSEYSK